MPAARVASLPIVLAREIHGRHRVPRNKHCLLRVIDGAGQA